MNITKNPQKRKLTLKQEKFTNEYIKTGNGTQSAIKAGYSKNSAQQIGTENLLKPLIKEKIQTAAEKLGITADYVLGNFKEIAEFNKKTVTKFITIGDDTFEDIKMRDANAAIKSNELLGKHLKLFTETVDINVKEETPDEERMTSLAKKMALVLSKASTSKTE